MDITHFRLVESVTELDLAARTIESQAVVPSHHSIFEGHFPGFEVFPGVLQVELIAQTAGLLILNVHNMEQVGLMVGIDKVRFRTFVLPGTPLTAVVRVVDEGSGYAICSGQTRLSSGVAASADLRFRVMDFPTPVMRESIVEIASRLCEPFLAQRLKGAER